MGNYRFIISGGGTGGHIYPAIAIANELKRRFSDAEFLFVGAKDKMEMEKVPQAGYRIKGLWISGLQRKLTVKNLLFPIKLISSLFRAHQIVRQFKPHVAVGTGGFASGPVLRMAAMNGIPTVLQEQNSFAGITNKLLASRAEKICVAYDGMERFFPASKVVMTGNPIRKDLIDIKVPQTEAKERFGFQKNATVVLVLGGSLGARRINQLVADHLTLFERKKVQLLWQCGKLYYSQNQNNQSETVKVKPFIKDMDHAYAAADLIISRAGAGSVSELCLVGKPTLFIPSPNVAEDHQTKNALALVNEGAAVMVEEEEIDERFEAVFQSLLEDADLQNRLAKRIKSLAMPHATTAIVDEIEKVLV